MIVNGLCQAKVFDYIVSSLTYAQQNMKATHAKVESFYMMVLYYL